MSYQVVTFNLDQQQGLWNLGNYTWSCCGYTFTFYSKWNSNRTRNYSVGGSNVSVVPIQVVLPLINSPACVGSAGPIIVASTNPIYVGNYTNMSIFVAGIQDNAAGTYQCGHTWLRVYGCSDQNCSSYSLLVELTELQLQQYSNNASQLYQLQVPDSDYQYIMITIESNAYGVGLPATFASSLIYPYLLTYEIQVTQTTTSSQETVNVSVYDEKSNAPIAGAYVEVTGL